MGAWIEICSSVFSAMSGSKTTGAYVSTSIDTMISQTIKICNNVHSAINGSKPIRPYVSTSYGAMTTNSLRIRAKCHRRPVQPQ